MCFMVVHTYTVYAPFVRECAKENCSMKNKAQMSEKGFMQKNPKTPMQLHGSVVMCLFSSAFG